MGFFDRIKDGLKKTAALFTPLTGDGAATARPIDAAFWDDLERALITADLGPAVAGELLEKLRLLHADKAVADGAEVLDALQKLLVLGVPSIYEMKLGKNPAGPTVILLVGVNGTGKTTTTAKIARYLVDNGKTVLLAAADTFRAAAGEQLDIWAARVGVEIVRHADGADPAAVVFDACAAATARAVDYVLVDTAGRLHTKENLMKQLEKICRVANKQIAGAPHEVLLILDATTGQNALSQARKFTEGAGVTGLVLTKLDGTAKGGIVLAINREIRLPIKFIGTGEKETDLTPFDPEEFCRALFAGMKG
ncbi:signal recognition particle receptor FtsY [Planctomycetales bacterium]|nr:signal recognition particle receptor FtsY [Planctomycetales bacterium]GHS99610.1 signal recognition particle receptor FtsY [Planctomycetales bacterium]GHT09234.1 signal recognition particle receptor FtsY [Planctomycetales bacterium]